MKTVKKFVADHASAIKHDLALFAAAVVATGVFDRGAPLTRDAIAAALVTAARRVVVQLVTSA